MKNKDYIFGGIEASDGVLKLGSEIRITIEEGEILFINTIGQTYKKVKFDTETSLILYVKEKFPIQE